MKTNKNLENVFSKHTKQLLRFFSVFKFFLRKARDEVLSLLSVLALEFLILSRLNVKQDHIRLIICPGKGGYITIFKKSVFCQDARELMPLYLLINYKIKIR